MNTVVNISNVVLSPPANIIMFRTAFGAILFARMLVVTTKWQSSLYPVIVVGRELVGN